MAVPRRSWPRNLLVLKEKLSDACVSYASLEDGRVGFIDFGIVGAVSWKDFGALDNKSICLL